MISQSFRIAFLHTMNFWDEFLLWYCFCTHICFAIYTLQGSIIVPIPKEIPYRAGAVQLSRIVLYHLKEIWFDHEAFRTDYLDQEKMEYLCTVKEIAKSYNYGLNFSDMDFLMEFTGLNYQSMFTECYKQYNVIGLRKYGIL